MNRPYGGGWSSIFYAFDAARRAGGFFKFYRAMRSRNACKTCAFGMGGQRGGMVNEAGRFPEVCKKSMQAMAADMQGRIHSSFFSKYGFDALRRLTPRELEHMGRLGDPVFAGPGDAGYRPISWDEAFGVCVSRLKASPPDETFFYFSGRSSNEAGFLLQLFARVFGTNNVNNCSYYCHQASGVGLSSVLGTGTATITLDDLAHCDCVFLIGGNPASNHPRMMTLLMELRRRGGHVIVINPLREAGLINFRVPSDVRSLFFGSPIASEYLPIHIGGDIAVLCGIAKRIVELGAADDGFLQAHTTGRDAVIEQLTRLTWNEIERASGVDRVAIDRAARIYASSRAAVFAWTMGITHHVHGVDNVRAICNLALLRGMVGRPHAGLLPIRGHSNVQGIGSVGVTPKLRDAVIERLHTHFGVAPPSTPGMDTMACMDAMHAGKIRNAFCLGGNLFGSNPDSAYAAAAFARTEFACYLSTTLNTGHAWGRARNTLILPVLARDEEPEPTTQESMFNYVRMSDGGQTRIDGPRSEVEIISGIARGVLGDSGPFDWTAMQHTRNIRAAIAKMIPGYEPIGDLDVTRQEFQISGRTIHEPRFHTPEHRARMHVTPIPERELADGELMLMTIRSEGQFNTVVYEDHDLYRGQDRRDVILLHPDDMAERGISADDPVTVASVLGKMCGVLARPVEIARGNAAMYYPEANAIVPRIADRESRTPAFKSVPITVTPEKTRGAVPLRLA